MKEKEYAECVKTDYSEYRLSVPERIFGFACGFAMSFAALYIMYSNVVIALCAGICFGLIFIPVYRKKLIKKRKKALLCEFRDMLESMQSSFSSGKNMSAAIDDAENDLKRLHGANSLLAAELSAIRDCLRNGENPEEAFEDFALRSGLDDIRSFSDTLTAALSAGGNLQKTVSDCREIICDRIGTETEIETVLASNKTELYIMFLMPFTACAAMKFMGADVSASNPALDLAVKTAALAVFVLSFVIGLKITDIKI